MKNELETVETVQYDSLCIDRGDKKVWIRRRMDCQTQAEILTDNPGTIKFLSGLAKENPEIINVLTEEGETHFHCIVGRELSINFTPATGQVEFWAETLEED